MANELTLAQINDIVRKMNGQNGSKIATLQDVAAVVSKCSGDHLEIGSFYGASAIVAVLAKRKAGQAGNVYCVDPFGYDRQEDVAIINMKMTPSQGDDIVNQFHANLKLFGVRDRVTLVQKPSHPWPDEIKGMRFDSVLIDGWHYDETPLQDAQNAVLVADKYIILDDVIVRYPSIVEAYEFILGTGEWKETYRSRNAVTFQKVEKNG